VLFSQLPQRAQPLLALIDASAESGLESLARLRLRGVAKRVETQVVIPGIGRGGGSGRVDLLLDGWLAIELDGDEFHDPKVDRVRNSALVRLGYRVHRFGYEQTVFDWGGVEATVRELLRYPPHFSRREGGICQRTANPNPPTAPPGSDLLLSEEAGRTTRRGPASRRPVRRFAPRSARHPCGGCRC
jgi:very-short-patch-repair endonuclease